jgi:hypothetical protein
MGKNVNSYGKQTEAGSHIEFFNNLPVSQRQSETTIVGIIMEFPSTGFALGLLI